MAQKQVLTLDDNQILKASVSKEGLTRLMIEGDRIKDIMGLDESVATEKDDQNGVLFLKNVTVPQTIALLTENGGFQEMELNPVMSKSHQIVLKQKKEKGEKQEITDQKIGRSFSTDTDKGEEKGFKSFSKTMITMMRRLYNAKISSTDKAPLSFKKLTNIKIDPLLGIGEKDLFGFSYVVQNKSDGDIILKESDFYQRGVLAVALLTDRLAPKQSTRLFVIFKG